MLELRMSSLTPWGYSRACAGITPISLVSGNTAEVAERNGVLNPMDTTGAQIRIVAADPDNTELVATRLEMAGH